MTELNTLVNDIEMATRKCLERILFYLIEMLCTLNPSAHPDRSLLQPRRTNRYDTIT